MQQGVSMGRFLVLGQGPFPPALGDSVVVGAWRTRHFCSALLEDGHEVCVLAATPPPEKSVRRLAQARQECLLYMEIDATLHLMDPAFLASVAAQFRPTALIGLGLKTAVAACRVAGEIPVWVDWTVCPLGAAQREAVFTGDSRAVVEARAAMAAIGRRADVFSCASELHSYALLGVLGMTGRLNAATCDYSFVYHIPLAHPAAPRRWKGESIRSGLVAEEDLVVVWCAVGMASTDVEMVAAGFELAVEQNPRMVLIAIGNDTTPGEAAVSRELRARLESGPAAARCRFVDRATEDAFAYYLDEADVALQIERPSYEGVLAARDWMLVAASYGAALIITRGSQQAAAVRAAECGYTIPLDAPRELADTLLHAAVHRQELARMGLRARAWFEQHCMMRYNAAPLLAWATAPRRAPDRGANEEELDRGTLRGGLESAG